MKFKVGDIVVCIDDAGYTSIRNGKKFRIIEIEDDLVILDNHVEYGYFHWRFVLESDMLKCETAKDDIRPIVII